MSLRDKIARLRLPVLGAPMFRASTPDLVIAQCRAGIIGSMPSRSVRDATALASEIRRIGATVTSADAEDATPLFAVNIVVHASNPRFEHDLDVCIAEQVPMIITSLGIAQDVINRVHDYGGYVLHDVTNMRHARKAIDAGVDGIIAVCTGAGGHTGMLSPFAFLRELRQEFDGVVAVAGAISDGYAILAALAAGADLAYMGTRFIASSDSGAPKAYREMIAASKAADIVNSSWLTGIPANFLRGSFEALGLDLANLPEKADGLSVDTHSKAASWGEIWGAGQGVGVIGDSPTVPILVDRLCDEYRAARLRLDSMAHETN